MRGVTISGQYGAGGSVVAPDVAKRLALPLLDRAISSEVASALHVSLPEAEDAEVKRTLVGKFFAALTPLAGGALGAGTDAAPPDAVPAPDDSALFRERAEAIMGTALEAGAVILGRAAAAAFHEEPGVLCVRLFGAADARIAQGARIEGVSVESARRSQHEVDHARDHYVRHLYGVGIDDPSLYHLRIDTTVVTLDGAAEMIATAYRSLSLQR
jgi:cytidylate kinase